MTTVEWVLVLGTFLTLQGTGAPSLTALPPGSIPSLIGIAGLCALAHRWKDWQADASSESSG